MFEFILKPFRKRARNHELLLKTADRIEQIPESYSQRVYYLEDSTAPCGTVSCLAGEIIVCSAPNGLDLLKNLYHNNIDSIRPTAERLAGLTGMGTVRKHIFSTSADGWPNKFRVPYDLATNQTDKAKVAAAFLRYLADGGKA